VAMGDAACARTVPCARGAEGGGNLIALPIAARVGCAPTTQYPKRGGGGGAGPRGSN